MLNGQCGTVGMGSRIGRQEKRRTVMRRGLSHKFFNSAIEKTPDPFGSLSLAHRGLSYVNKNGGPIAGTAVCDDAKGV